MCARQELACRVVDRPHQAQPRPSSLEQSCSLPSHKII
jgi:hypothetical protein